MERLVAKMDEYNEKNCKNFGIRYFSLKMEYPSSVNYSFETEGKCFQLLQEEIERGLKGFKWSNDLARCESNMIIVADSDGEKHWITIPLTSRIGYINSQQRFYFAWKDLQYVFPKTIEGFLTFLGMVEKLILENPYAAEKEKICSAIGTTYKAYIGKIVDSCIKDIERQFHAKEQYCRDYYEEQIRWLDGEEKGTLLQVEEESEEEEE